MLDYHDVMLWTVNAIHSSAREGFAAFWVAIRLNFIYLFQHWQSTYGHKKSFTSQIQRKKTTTFMSFSFSWHIDTPARPAGRVPLLFILSNIFYNISEHEKHLAESMPLRFKTTLPFSVKHRQEHGQDVYTAQRKHFPWPSLNKKIKQKSRLDRLILHLMWYVRLVVASCADVGRFYTWILFV